MHEEFLNNDMPSGKQFLAALQGIRQYERTSCECSKCQTFCRHIPGTALPGDILTLARHLGREDEDHTYEFTAEFFQATEGTSIVCGEDSLQVPTMIPRQKPNGECIFYEEGRCRIHPAAPFGCRTFNACDGAGEEPMNNQRMLHALTIISASPVYLLHHARLVREGQVARPQPERIAEYVAELDALEETDS